MMRQYPLAADELPGWRAFRALPQDAREAGLELIPIRPRSRDAETALSGGDYDVLMAPDAFPPLVQVLFERAAIERASFSIRREHAHKVQVFFHVPERGRSIVLEIWTRLEVRDPARKSARFIAHAALAPLMQSRSPEPRLPAAIEIAYYLSHLATREKNLGLPLVAQRLEAYRELASSDAPEMRALLDEIAQRGIERTAIDANERLRSLGVLARKSRVSALVESIAARFASALRAARRRRLRRACVIAVTGPDGSGKSTLIEAWKQRVDGSLRVQRFKGLFRHHPAYQLLHWLRRGRDASKDGAPMAKNRFDERHARPLFHIARSTWPLFRAWARVAGRRCLDRGFPDLLFERLRETDAEPALFADWLQLARCMPKPDWHLYLDAPDETIRARKRELSVAALRCYRRGMAQIVGVAPALGFSRVDTSTSVETTVAALRLASECLGVKMRWSDRP